MTNAWPWDALRHEMDARPVVTPGREGGSMMRREWMSAREAAEVLGVSERHARRMCKPYSMGVVMDYTRARARSVQRYRADAVRALAQSRHGAKCVVCDAPCRPHATTCGTDACACKAYRMRRDEAARARRKARGIAW